MVRCFWHCQLLLFTMNLYCHITHVVKSLFTQSWKLAMGKPWTQWDKSHKWGVWHWKHLTTSDHEQSWQSVGLADLPGPDPTGISCSRSVSVPGRSFWSWIRSGSVWGSSAVGRIGLLFRKYWHKVGRELKSGQFPDEAGIWQWICRAA